MKNALLILVLLISGNLVAEDTIPVNTTYKDGSKNEVYFTNKDGNRTGKYVRYTRYGKVYTEGQYNNGTPVGVWNYYSADTAGKLVQTLNFDTHKETYVDSSNVNSLVCGPRYFGGNAAKQEYIQLRIRNDFTDQEKAAMKGKSVMAVFEVDILTLTTYAISVENYGYSRNVIDKMNRIIAEMPAWLPPVCDKGDHPVWRQSVVFVF
jgi:hypothetical protein